MNNAYTHRLYVKIFTIKNKYIRKKGINDFVVLFAFTEKSKLFAEHYKTNRCK